MTCDMRVASQAFEGMLNTMGPKLRYLVVHHVKRCCGLVQQCNLSQEYFCFAELKPIISQCAFDLQEDAMRSAENMRCLAFSKEPRLQERKRNRDKMLEIQKVCMITNCQQIEFLHSSFHDLYTWPKNDIGPL
jgi:hypothetical protein